jgi:hypothetical protein
MARPGDRQLKANAFVRQVDEIAAREGCDLPVPLLIAMVRLFGEALACQLDASASAEARYEFTRCGAIDDAASVPRSRCVRRRGHAGQHFAVNGAAWGDEVNAAGEHAGVGEVIELLCFTGCGAAATDGRFCCNHRGDG